MSGKRKAGDATRFKLIFYIRPGQRSLAPPAAEREKASPDDEINIFYLLVDFSTHRTTIGCNSHSGDTEGEQEQSRQNNKNI